MKCPPPRTSHYLGHHIRHLHRAWHRHKTAAAVVASIACGGIPVVILRALPPTIARPHDPQPIPEPAPLAVLGVGLIGIWLATGRRNGNNLRECIK